jgi:hypothetical protein
MECLLDTGETFNGAGKTDILIRVEDRNVFIDECKWWSGPAAVDQALDQLFPYATWRDTKLALIFFVANKDITTVIARARELIQARAEFINRAGDPEHGELRCEMTWPADDSILAQLGIFFVHLTRDTSAGDEPATGPVLPRG